MFSVRPTPQQGGYAVSYSAMMFRTCQVRSLRESEKIKGFQIRSGMTQVQSSWQFRPPFRGKLNKFRTN